MKSNQPRHGRDASLRAGIVACLSRGLMQALVVLCLGAIAPAHAEEEARMAGQTDAKAGKAPAYRPAGEALVKQVFDRGHPSDKENAEVLLPLTGTWGYMASVWAVPGAEPQQSDGTMTNQMILGNRFLSMKALGSLYIIDHYVPLESDGTIGFDTSKNSFASSWADSLTTGLAAAGGKFDEKKRVLTLTGKFTHPLTGVEGNFRSEIRFVDPGHYTQTIFAADKSGKESRLMEFDCTRKN